MKKIILIICSIFILAGCGGTSSKYNFKIDCTFDSPFTGKVYVRHYNGHQLILDSLAVNGKSQFDFKQKIEVSDNYSIYTKPYVGACYFIAEPGASYEISFTAEEQNASLVSHTSTEQTILDKGYEVLADYSKEIQRLSEEYSDALNQKDEERIQSSQAEVTVVFRRQEKALVEFIKEHHDSYAAVSLTSNLFFERYPSYVEINDLLDVKKYSNTSSYVSFKKKMDEMEAVWIEGKQAPDFTTKDMYGNSLSLSDFRGKYVLLDFWASWCKPCRLKTKELKKIYPELKKKGIVVLGINLDEDRDKWLKATKEDEIVWNNTGEFAKFEENTIAKSYKVRQIPTLFLIDPDGQIIRQNPDEEFILSFLAK